MPGEDSHDKGNEGLRKAANWLQRSTRVSESYNRHDLFGRRYLSGHWPYGSQGEFSFDLGGNFAGGDLYDQYFKAEVKNYTAEHGLPELFRRFVGISYVDLLASRDAPPYYLWIAWSPFRARQWDKHCSIDSITKALTHADNAERVTGIGTIEGAKAALDSDTVRALSERIWLITLSDQQAELVPTKEHYGLIKGLQAMGEVF